MPFIRTFVILFFDYPLSASTLLILIITPQACFGGLYLGPNSPTALLHRYARQQREAPQISMRSVARHWFKVQCTVQQGSLSVFVNCPSLPDSPCYENCIPTQPCPKGASGEGCLPDKTAVNCTEKDTPSGGKVTILWIDNRDPRLLGDWICMNRGLKSSKVEVRF